MARPTLALLILSAAAVACGRGPPPGVLTLRVTTVTGGAVRVADDGAVLAGVVDEVRLHGAVDRECHLIVVAVEAGGIPARLLAAGDAEVGDLVGPGPFRLPGGRAFEPRPWPVRLVAACGGPELRLATVVSAAIEARGRAGVDGMKALAGLPPGTLQASRLFRLSP